MAPHSAPPTGQDMTRAEATVNMGSEVTLPPAVLTHSRIGAELSGRVVVSTP